MTKKINHDDDSLDSVDEYFRQKKNEEEDESYFPIEEAAPPHY